MTTEIDCVLCLAVENQQHVSRARTFGADHDLNGIHCNKCGPYAIDWALNSDMRNSADSDRQKGARNQLLLSGVCREAVEHGRGPVEITEENFEALIASANRPASYAGYVDRVITLIADRAPTPGASARWSMGALAAMTYVPVEHLQKLIRQLVAQGLASVHESILSRLHSDTLMELDLTPAGWERADSLDRGVRGTRVFVAMWFADDMKDAYLRGIRPVLSDCGYSAPFRVDDDEHDLNFGTKAHERKIDDRVMAGILRAKFVVADATGSRPAVYFEAGFAEGHGIPVIWTCRDDDKANLCFDTRQHAHLLWKDPGELAQKLKARIQRAGWDLNRS